MTLVHTGDGLNVSYRASGEVPLTLLFMHGWSKHGVRVLSSVLQLREQPFSPEGLGSSTSGLWLFLGKYLLVTIAVTLGSR
jgi:hypothetical protein